jgi:hypothetical protein
VKGNPCPLKESTLNEAGLTAVTIPASNFIALVLPGDMFALTIGTFWMLAPPSIFEIIYATFVVWKLFHNPIQIHGLNSFIHAGFNTYIIPDFLRKFNPKLLFAKKFE